LANWSSWSKCQHGIIDKILYCCGTVVVLVQIIGWASRLPFLLYQKSKHKRPCVIFFSFFSVALFLYTGNTPNYYKPTCMCIDLLHFLPFRNTFFYTVKLCACVMLNGTGWASWSYCVPITWFCLLVNTLLLWPCVFGFCQHIVP